MSLRNLINSLNGTNYPALCEKSVIIRSSRVCYRECSRNCAALTEFGYGLLVITEYADVSLYITTVTIFTLCSDMMELDVGHSCSILEVAGFRSCGKTETVRGPFRVQEEESWFDSNCS